MTRILLDFWDSFTNHGNFYLMIFLTVVIIWVVLLTINWLLSLYAGKEPEEALKEERIKNPDPIEDFVPILKNDDDDANK